MLQRIQSVWMFLAVIFAAFTFKFSFYSGNRAVDTTGHVFYSVTAASSILLMLVTAIIIVGGLINIFGYKNRRRQILINVALTILGFLNIFLYYRETQNHDAVNGFTEGKYDLTAVLAIFVPLFFILAIRGIARDQKLVKSADRLR